MWLFAGIGSALYTFAWDLTMDWGLFIPHASSHAPADCFGRRLLFKNHRWAYHVAIFLDLFLRFAWTVTLMPAGINPYFGSSTGTDLVASANYEMIFLPCIMGGEVFRRMMWAILRVEHEHLTLVDQFSTFDFVPMYFKSKAAQAAAVAHPAPRGGSVWTEIIITAVVVTVITVLVTVVM